MNDRSLGSARHPVPTLVVLTAAALAGPARIAEPRLGPVADETLRPLSLLDRLVDGLDRWLWSARQRNVERVLTNATDVTDVEARLRARERSLLYRYY